MGHKRRNEHGHRNRNPPAGDNHALPAQWLPEADLPRLGQLRADQARGRAMGPDGAEADDRASPGRVRDAATAWLAALVSDPSTHRPKRRKACSQELSRWRSW